MRSLVRVGLILAVCSGLASLGACDRARDLVRSPDEKRSAAFAPSAQATAARAALAKSMSNSAQQAAFHAAFETRVLVRARLCSANQSIGRFTVSADLRLHAARDDCRADDPALQDWLGQRKVALVLALPAVDPAVALRPLRKISVTNRATLLHFALAARADVALMVDSADQYLVIKASTGAPLRRLTSHADPDVPPLLSPNGRLVAMPLGQGRWQVVDLVSGVELWSTSGLGRLLAWLPEQAALVASDAADGKTLLVDLREGTRPVHKAVDVEAVWAWFDDAAPDQLWVGHPDKLLRVRHERSAAGVGSQTLRTLGARALVGRGVDPPLIVQGRWWIGHDGRNNLGIIDLQQSPVTITKHALVGRWGGAALLHAQRVALCIQLPDGSAALQVLDPVRRTVSRVPMQADTRLVAARGRAGLALASRDAVLYGDQLDAASAPIGLDEWLPRMPR